MKQYLEEKGLIDISNIRAYALELTKNLSSSEGKAKILYTFVRDEIKHSADINESKVTKYASEI